jgi:HK97 family phage major capsid protein
MASIADLIVAAEANVNAKRGLAEAYKVERAALIAPLAATESLDADSQARFDKLTADKREADLAVVALEAKVAELRAEQATEDKAERDAKTVTPTTARKVDPITVGAEKRTYNAGSASEGVSFFRDAWFAERGERSAKERIERHMTEASVEGEMSQRAGTTTGFAGLVPPVYLTDQAALIARAGRPTANIVQHLQLPSTGQSIIIPRNTTGASEAIQATENLAVSNTDEVWSNLTVPVVTIAGQQDISRQSLERAEGIDQIIYNDLAAAYAVALDQQVLSGTGSAGQMLGITLTGSVGQSTAFVAAATVATFYTKLAGALNNVETGRYLAPNVIIMHPRRWNWLLSQVDSSNRPYVVPNTNGPFNSIGVSSAPIDVPSTEPVGWILGVPVITDASVPTSVGTGPEDLVIVARKEDLLLWENGDGAPFQLRFEQTTGGSLTTKLVAYNYAAFTAGRYPAAVSLVGGNSGAGFGLIAPTF